MDTKQPDMQSVAPINTLKEAIAHAKEVAKGGSTCALEHAKLAAWLTELQLWRDSSFTLAVGAELRKQNEAVIRQMLRALDDGSDHTAQCVMNYWPDWPCDCGKSAAVTAARLWLKSKP